jgi:hypothetical protein
MPTSTVDEVHILTQAVKNTKTTLEIIRESISNSVDAEARNISIVMTHTGGSEWDVVIDDDGYGMLSTHLQAFFSAGMSLKNYGTTGALPVIGEKGLGSKTVWKARNIRVETIYHTGTDMIIAEMNNPMAALQGGNLPTWTESTYAAGTAPAGSKTTRGVRIILSRLDIRDWNGSNCKRNAAAAPIYDVNKIKDRLMHYIRTRCATGTNKLRHSAKAHVVATVAGATAANPNVTLTVIEGGATATISAPGCYDLPNSNPAPNNGDPHGTFPLIREHSKKFCMSMDGTGTRNIGGNPVHYDWTAIIAGADVQKQLIGNETKSGVGAKSLMGIHFCKDFIPLPRDETYSKEALDAEYYFQYKVFLNSQSFELNADRSMITNLESDEVEWILRDFIATAKPLLNTQHEILQNLVKAESAAIEASKKLAKAQQVIATYTGLGNLITAKPGVVLDYVKTPSKEVDVSHIIAAMFQEGNYATDFAPLARFGKFVDSSTDAIFEDSAGGNHLVEIEYSLRNLFSHGHPIDSFHSVIVWTLGGLVRGYSHRLPWGAGGVEIPVTLRKDAGNNWILSWGTEERRLYVIEEFI